jgi:uncharacterized protein YgfB (UPF0149 family)
MGVNPWLKLIANMTLAILMSFLEFHGVLAGSRCGMGVNPWLKLIENITLAILMSFLEFHGHFAGSR